MTILTRSVQSEVEATGRNLEGLAYRWNVPSWVSDVPGKRYREAFTQSTAEGVTMSPLHFLHPTSPGARSTPEPFGIVEYHASAEGLAFKARVSETRLGDDMLTLLADGALGRQVSIGYKPLKSRDANGITYRDQIELIELSLLPASVAGAHDGAAITTVRNEIETPNLDAVQRRIRLMALGHTA